MAANLLRSAVLLAPGLALWDAAAAAAAAAALSSSSLSEPPEELPSEPTRGAFFPWSTGQSQEEGFAAAATHKRTHTHTDT